MIQPINTLKGWFKTGSFPSQQQFWDWMDSYWHKKDKIPVASIEGLEDVATKEDLDAAIESVNKEITANLDLIEKLEKDISTCTSSIEQNDTDITWLKNNTPVHYFSINEFSTGTIESTLADNGFFLCHEDMIGRVLDSICLRSFSKSVNSTIASVYTIHAVGIDGSDTVVDTITMLADQLYYVSSVLNYVIQRGDVFLITTDTPNPEARGISATFRAIRP